MQNSVKNRAGIPAGVRVGNDPGGGFTAALQRQWGYPLFLRAYRIPGRRVKGVQMRTIQTEKPRWDRERRELLVGDVVVRPHQRPSPNQELLLAAFEEQEWPERIDDPLLRSSVDSKRRLHDTVKSLNRSIPTRAVRFGGDGTGMGVLWTLDTEQMGQLWVQSYIAAALPILAESDVAWEEALAAELARKRNIRQQLRRVDPRCRYCGAKLSKRRTTLDHVVPRSRGGADDLTNLVLACRGCNLCKGTRTLTEWLDDLRRAIETVGGAA